MRILIILFFICQTAISQNTVFKSKVPYLNFRSQTLFNRYHENFYSRITTVDSILIKNPSLEINFNLPFVLEQQKVELDGKMGKMLKPMLVLVLPNDTINIGGKKMISTSFQSEVDLINQLGLQPEWYRGNQNLNKPEKEPEKVNLSNLYKQKSILKLDSVQFKIRPVVYDIFKKMIEIQFFVENNQFQSKKKIFVKETDIVDSLNVEELEAQFQFINTIKPEEYQVYSFLISRFFNSTVELLASKYNENSKVESVGKALGLNLNLLLRDSFMSILVHNLALQQRVSFRFLYDFFDNCEEQSAIDLVYNVVSYGRLAANDVELKATNLTKLDGENITWEEHLKLNKGKIVYDVVIDEVSDSTKKLIKKVRKFHELNKEVVINFITKSANDEAWLGILSNLGIATFGKHYRLNLEPLLARVLTENSMPRGLLISKESRIVSIFANDPEAKYFKEYLEEAEAF